MHPVNAEPEIAVINQCRRDRLVTAERRQSHQMHSADTSSLIPLASRLHRARTGFAGFWPLGAHRQPIAPVAPAVPGGRI